MLKMCKKCPILAELGDPKGYIRGLGCYPFMVEAQAYQSQDPDRCVKTWWTRSHIG